MTNVCQKCGSTKGFLNKKYNYTYFYRGLCPSCCKSENAFYTKQVDDTPRRKQAEYRIWRLIKDRCENPRAHYYSDYGGRGIQLSPEWHDYAVFLRDMGKRPSPKHSIDRIDVEKGYCKENCRWATRHQQAANRRISNSIVGVRYEGDVRKTWLASLRVNGERVLSAHLHSFEGAVIARRLAERLYGIEL